MTVESQDRRQKAVMWPFDSYLGNGDPSYGSPVQIKVRTERMISEMVAPTEGRKQKPYTVFVDREIALGSRMWFGKLTDLPDPLTVVFQVISYEGTPDIKCKYTEHVVTVMRGSV